MLLAGGNLTVVATEKFNNLDEVLLLVFELHNVYQIFTPYEYNEALKYKSLIDNKKNILIDGIDITFQESCYNDIYPALDFFEDKFSNDEAIHLSAKAEQLDRIIHVNIRAKNSFDLKFGLYWILAIATLSNGIINSTAFTHFSECNAKGNFHTSKEWFNILSVIYRN